MSANTEARLHALDAVRAFALLCGIVLHAAMSFMPGLAAVGFPADSSPSETLEAAFYVIHLFRMPLFFMIAGYFAHLLLRRKGTALFVRDRAKRILLPFAAGWLLFGPIAMALVYMALGPPLPEGRAGALPEALPLAHLWFLYYLLLLYVGALALHRLVALLDRRGTLRASIDAAMSFLCRSPFAPALLAIPIAACLYLTPGWVLWSGIASPDAGLLPRWPPIIGFGTAFLFGWLLQRQNDVLAVWQGRCLPYLGAAVALTAASFWLVERVIDPLAVAPGLELTYAALYATAMWYWIFGIVGAAQRFFAKESSVWRYLADSSYWLYLAHLPVVFALQLTVRSWPLHWSLKFPLVVLAAVALLLVSYHYLVRFTWLGKLLNGGKHERRAGRRQAALPAPSAALR
jgi:glucan biosynthesis protein C